MKTEIQDSLKTYIEVFDEAKKCVNDDAVAAALVEQVGKDHRASQIRAERNGNHAIHENGIGNDSNDDTPATEKQLAFLRRLGVDVDGDISKQRASELIDEAQAK